MFPKLYLPIKFSKLSRVTVTSLCLSLHHTTKKNDGEGRKLLLSSSRNCVAKLWWLVSFTLRPLWMEGWMVSRAGLNVVAKRKVLHPAKNRTPVVRPVILHKSILAHSNQIAVLIPWFQRACYMPYQFPFYLILLLLGPSSFLTIKKRVCITRDIAKSVQTSEESLCSIRPMWNQGHQGNVTSWLANRNTAAVEIHYSLSESYTHIAGRPWPLFEIFSSSLLFSNMGTVKGYLWRHLQWLQ
jgi:hypothetical protein